MKTFFRASLAIGTLIAATAGSPLAFAQTVLRYSNWLPAGHPLRAQVMEPWSEEVAKVTQGRVKVEWAPKVVGTVAGQFDTISDGLADVALFVPSYTPGKFEITELMELPFLAEKASIRSPATHRFFTKHLAQFNEYKGIQPLSVFTGPAQHIYTAKRAIKTVDDIQGLKLRSPSPTVSQGISLLGGVPVVKPAPDIYEMVSGGLLDGAVFTTPDSLSFKLTTVVPKAHIVEGGFSATVIVLAMNPAKWQALSKADQDAIMSVSGEKLALGVGTAYDKAEQEALEATRKAGGTVERLSPAVVAAMKQKTLPVEQATYEKARKRGVPDPVALVNALRADLSAASR
ncbi:TRAP transporter substrate-binding protein [Variovorax paradoxus]|nr:TRAP transporter substrate-binding protein [Variovorax paradoxus]MBT2301944.1 TRAP transporter substrate-binding protein [Variovorax paradoxus]